MDINRQVQSRRQRSRDLFDRRVDNWIETGRQFVDGVAGNRPGKRKAFTALRDSGSSFDSVGRWVGEKLDWLLEDEDDWLEPWESEVVTEMNDSSSKRPLEAISRRTSQANSSSERGSYGLLSDEQWPDDESFRVDRWERTKEDLNRDDFSNGSGRRPSRRSERRPLPRSSRKRDDTIS